nr:MAG TPA: hypothetical protein [Crassvirales sp.]
MFGMYGITELNSEFSCAYLGNRIKHISFIV